MTLPPDEPHPIDLKTLIEGPHMDTVCEYSNGVPLPVETVRRHACTANIIPVVLDGDGQPLEVGRESRLATPAQRRTLRSMYRAGAVDESDAMGQSSSCDESRIPRSLLSSLRRPQRRERSELGAVQTLRQLDPSTHQLDVYLPDGTLHSQALPDLIAERAA